MARRVRRSWAARIGTAFKLLALLVFGAALIMGVLLGTVYRTPHGCEECSPYVELTLGVVACLVLALIFGIVALTFAGFAQRTGRNPGGSRPSTRRSRL